MCVHNSLKRTRSLLFPSAIHRSAASDAVLQHLTLFRSGETEVDRRELVQVAPHGERPVIWDSWSWSWKSN